MSADTVKDPTETPQKKWTHMTALEKEQLLREMAVGTPLWVLASRYGKSYDHIRDISSKCKEQIAEIRKELGQELNILWAQDLMYRAMELQSSIENVKRQQRKIEKTAELFEDSTEMDLGVVHEHWHKLDQHKAKLIHQLGEMLGQLPTRAPAAPPDMGKATYEIPGVDLGEVVRSWEQPVEVPK